MGEHLRVNIQFKCTQNCKSPLSPPWKGHLPFSILWWCIGGCLISSFLSLSPPPMLPLLFHVPSASPHTLFPIFAHPSSWGLHQALPLAALSSGGTEPLTLVLTSWAKTPVRAVHKSASVTSSATTRGRQHHTITTAMNIPPGNVWQNKL